MLELRARHRGVVSVINRETKLSKLLQKDICYLEFRMMCEVMALASLVIHGDIPLTHTRPLRDEYKADKIIRKLEELHPDFYPRPVTQRLVGPPGKRLAHLTKFSLPYLTQKRLVSLYRECNDQLHRGHVSNLSDNKVLRIDRERLSTYAYLWSALMLTHVIRPKDSDLTFLVRMGAASNGSVDVFPCGPDGVVLKG